MSKLQVLVRLVLGVVMVCISIHAQAQNHIWYFGHNAGIDFSTVPPTALFNGVLWTGEGCATLTNSQGELLMYTDGITVYNRIHQQMPNGFGLLGHSSSTQSAIIVPQPGNDSVYFVFTTPSQFQGRLCYSKVNMTEDNGFGDVILKNVALHDSASEQLSAVLHSNGVDYWVLTRQKNTNSFLAYLVTSAGVNPIPVISGLGPILVNPLEALGQLKFSQDGYKVAHVMHHNPAMLLADFDPVTGFLSNEVLLGISFSAGYGVEFSPSGKYLYSSNFANINQWDLSLPSATAIAASRETIVPPLLPFEDVGALQLAPDGKIYVARPSGIYLGVINEPELPGLLCNYQHNGISIAPRACAWGLPTSVQSLIYNPIVIIANGACSGSPIKFSVQSSAEIQNHLWDFGDPGSGALNSSSDSTPTHIYSTPGVYTVTFVGTIGTTVYTQNHQIEILPAPTATISPTGPITLCSGTTQNLQATALPGLTYQWLQNGQPLATDTLPNLTVSASGNYQVLVSDGVCSALSDTIEGTVYPEVTAIVSPAGPLTACASQPVQLNAAQSTGSSFAWLQNGQPVSAANGLVFAPSSSGSYQVVASHNGLCPDTSAAVAVTILPVPEVELFSEGNYYFCQGAAITLSANPLLGAAYQWLHNGTAVSGADTLVFAASSPGNYQVVASFVNGCSDTSGTAVLWQHPQPEVTILQQGQLACTSSVTLTATGADTYYWNTGVFGPSIEVYPGAAGLYSVTGQSQFGCQDSDSVTIPDVICNPLISVPNIITPNNDGVNDVLEIAVQGEPFDLYIINRWGKTVYNQSNYHLQQNWSADNLPAGVYYYHIKTQKGVAYNGWIEILR